MTQSELAKHLHIHITTVKNWESAACVPDARNICALADLFHVTTDYLLGREYSDTISLDGLTPCTAKTSAPYRSSIHRYFTGEQ
ncbi:MAG: helix-turn-helix transcriptional regulator [Clostridia bacterium]|nr:helix-turn-helix transcriptional regulator [Clostridia bacterium]